jgi:hypothetical protein
MPCVGSTCGFGVSGTWFVVLVVVRSRCLALVSPSPFLVPLLALTVLPGRLVGARGLLRVARRVRVSGALFLLGVIVRNLALAAVPVAPFVFLLLAASARGRGLVALGGPLLVRRCRRKILEKNGYLKLRPGTRYS